MELAVWQHNSYAYNRDGMPESIIYTTYSDFPCNDSAITITYYNFQYTRESGHVTSFVCDGIAEGEDGADNGTLHGSYTYNDRGLLTSVQHTTVSDGTTETNVFEFAYDENNNLIRKTQTNTPAYAQHATCTVTEYEYELHEQASADHLFSAQTLIESALIPELMIW